MNELDQTDLRLLRLLQEDGRLSNAELAQKGHTSPATCHRRVQRLFREGYISGVRAVVNPQKVGLGSIAFVGVELDRSTPESFARFEKEVRGIAEVLECHLVAGALDYLLKIRVRDLADFNRMHVEVLIALPEVRMARTFFVIREVKEGAPLQF